METEPSGPLIALTIVAIFAGFALVWPLVILLLSMVSGWRSLASRYGDRRAFSGSLFRLQSGQMRWVGLNRCLNIGADREGVYLSMPHLFGVFHAPLFVPWSEITITTRNKWIRQGVEFRLGSGPGVPLWVESQLAERLREHAPSADVLP